MRGDVWVEKVVPDLQHFEVGLLLIEIDVFEDVRNNLRNVSGRRFGSAFRLAQISAAMRAFYDATVALQLADKVTTFTLSDFGRTLQPAGSGAAQVGTDHAWGNHHFVMGGAVQGGRLFGTYPTLALGGPDDTDSGGNPRGRWIPTTSVEEYAATLASWYGLASVDLPAVFPLIGRFQNPNLGFML